MSNQFSNPLNNLGSPVRSAIYRPKYRVATENPSYALENQVPVRQQELPGLFHQVQALEEWCKQEEARKRNVTPRWHPDKAKAICVYICPAPQPSWSNLILRACHEWESASAGLIQFMIGVQPDKADVIIEWTDQVTPGRDFEVGHTRCDLHPPHWISRATITLLVQPEIDKHLDSSQMESRLYTTILHELGHALGLEHSQHNRDVMHHQGWRNPRLTPNDALRLNQLYNQPVPTLFWL